MLPHVLSVRPLDYSSYIIHTTCLRESLHIQMFMMPIRSMYVIASNEEAKASTPPIKYLTNLSVPSTGSHGGYVHLSRSAVVSM